MRKKGGVIGEKRKQGKKEGRSRIQEVGGEKNKEEEEEEKEAEEEEEEETRRRRGGWG